MAGAGLVSKSALLCLLFLAFTPIIASEARAAAELLEPSVYHAEEVSAKAERGRPGWGCFQQRWLAHDYGSSGLRLRAGHYELKQTKENWLSRLHLSRRRAANFRHELLLFCIAHNFRASPRWRYLPTAFDNDLPSVCIAEKGRSIKTRVKAPSQDLRLDNTRRQSKEKP